MFLLVACGGGGGNGSGGGGSSAVDGSNRPGTMSGDSDGDLIRDDRDNCPTANNTSQLDADADGEGDVCDATPGGTDFDGDGISDTVDNCRADPNANQSDVDGDGSGDVCDDTPNGPDRDLDGIIDSVDNCPFIANPEQIDSNGDGTGDRCESAPADGDGDEVADTDDNCPSMSNPDQTDADGDGLGDVCDPTPMPDMDGDGVADARDNCIAEANDQTDSDGDGIGDACDPTPQGPDSDGDSVPNDRDNCPADSNRDQLDSDGDGVGDVCEVFSSDSAINPTNYRFVVEQALVVAVEILGSRYDERFVMPSRNAGGSAVPRDVFVPSVIDPEFGVTLRPFDCAESGSVEIGTIASRRTARVFDACRYTSGDTSLRGSHLEVLQQDMRGFTRSDRFESFAVGNGPGSYGISGTVVVEGSSTQEDFSIEIAYDDVFVGGGLDEISRFVNQAAGVFFSDISGTPTIDTIESSFELTLLPESFENTGSGRVMISLAGTDVLNDGVSAELEGTVIVEAEDGSSVSVQGVLSEATVTLIDSAGTAAMPFVHDFRP